MEDFFNTGLNLSVGFMPTIVASNPNHMAVAGANLELYLTLSLSKDITALPVDSIKKDVMANSDQYVYERQGSSHSSALCSFSSHA